MATTSTAQAHWEGSLFEGSGQVELVTSGLATFDVAWGARAESGQGATNPEELIAAAHATCFSMALSNILAKNDTPPASLDTKADVTFVPGTGITGSHLTVVGRVPGLTADEFLAFAGTAKAECPVSQALAGVEITMDASFEE
ncbi:OsmC family peroxiredoxin [Tessaracoccus sp. MC1679]|uniref:OsmC family peroxiredoxin n=1 Tax=Tessaracoccus sp. MC1679 TaxID=2760313 RepID=UPI00160389B3|nr:OsmC family peroxiredoxin [Tessaracoccus sp. MC1679]MBB1516340.1 OsmC family peroxiredoxin [Tessaracoccus sp. MC1679]